MRKRIAVIGAGISGLSAAYHLREQAEVTLFEAGAYFGGHTNTVDVTLTTDDKPCLSTFDIELAQGMDMIHSQIQQAKKK